MVYVSVLMCAYGWVCILIVSSVFDLIVCMYAQFIAERRKMFRIFRRLHIFVYMCTGA